ncbi:MAG: GNAT family N-acetyltransferase [Bacteroidetes bacterium]|nr:GNAT family N-acetyltransferase [Bacteroidota bacterium]MBL0137250.1 GNAT family N-acetyltransferase [Bacteroidota bacterium]
MNSLELNFTPFPELKTERLVLRRILMEDAQALFEMRSDERVMQFLDRPRAKSIADAENLIRLIDHDIENNIGITWGVSLTGTSRLIGTMGFWNITKAHFRAEIGYLLHPDFQGKGLMIESAKKTINFGFREMGLHSIEANINPNNLRSAKMLEKCGFVKEAHFRENYYYDGKFLDSVIYSLLNNPLKHQSS